MTVTAVFLTMTSENTSYAFLCALGNYKKNDNTFNLSESFKVLNVL